MNNTVASITKSFLNLIYPLRCECCKDSLDPMDTIRVCGRCQSAIKLNPAPYCGHCGRSGHFSEMPDILRLRRMYRSITERGPLCSECGKSHFVFKSASAACLYEGVSKELIHSFKYKGKRYLSAILSRLMLDFIKENRAILNGMDVITFVPITGSRERDRAFNQSKILAYIVSEEYDLPAADLLKKSRDTKHQSELSRAERLVNLKGSFKMKKNTNIEDLGVLLVDDVMTTGATFNECSVTLLNAGAKEVKCLSLARGM